MKILQVLPELNEGGVERGVIELNREFVLKGLTSYVISAGGKLQSEVLKDGGEHIKFDVCSKNPFSVPFRVYKLRKIIKDLTPDIIHVRSRVPAWLVYFANKTLNIKVISTVHGFNSVSFYSKIMTNADHIICVSASIKEYIQKHYRTKDNKITIIPRGIDLEVFNSTNLDHIFIQDFIKNSNLENKFIVSTVGRITQLKDYETFIKSIAIIKQENKTIVGLIVGGIREDKQEYFNSLKKLIKELDLDKNIYFTGSHSKIAEIYHLSDVVVSSSKKPESFGRAVAEAIALNTPVVATNHGGVKDIIVENENGYFFDVGDEIALSQYIKKSLDLKFDGYNYILNNFSLDKMTEKTINVYENVWSSK